MSENQVVVKKQSEITDQVFNKVQQLEEAGSLVLPKSYAAGNALKSAQLILAETKDKNQKFALEVCTKESIANCLLDMVKMGLEPSKKQCYFVVYGDKLQLMTSYFGKIAIAKRVSDLEEIKAFVIYEGDEFEMEFNLDDLCMQLKKYKPNPANVNLDKITGAFAIPVFKDGTRGDLVYLSYQQIKNSWSMGSSYQYGKSKAHNNFTDEMCKKTIITRVCKMLINSSDDGDLVDVYQGAEEETTQQAEQKEVAASKEFVEVVEYEEVQTPITQHQQTINVEGEECPI